MHQIVYNLIRKRKWLNDFIVFSKFFTWVRSNIQRIYSNTFLKLCTQWAKNVKKKVHFCRTKPPAFWLATFLRILCHNFFLLERDQEKLYKKTYHHLYNILYYHLFPYWNLQGNLSFFSGNPDSVNTIYCRMYWRTGK